MVMICRISQLLILALLMVVLTAPVLGQEEALRWPAMATMAWG